MTNYDDDLWTAAMADVTPLKGKKIPKSAKKYSPQNNDILYNSIHNIDDIPMQDTTNRFMENVPPSQSHNFVPLKITSNDVKCISGHAEGVDGKLRKKFFRGEFGFTDRLDLHGFYEGDAWMATMDFLHEAADNGHRYVIIIHGKGKGYGENRDMGIIKSQIAAWLSNHPKVMAFCTATSKDGGDGAIYVYLRRRKNI